MLLKDNPSMDCIIISIVIFFFLAKSLTVSKKTRKSIFIQAIIDIKKIKTSRKKYFYVFLDIKLLTKCYKRPIIHLQSVRKDTLDTKLSKQQRSNEHEILY